MKEKFNYVLTIEPLETEYVFKIEATSKIEAIRKLKTLGFNCGKLIKSYPKGEWKVKDIFQLGKIKKMKTDGGQKWEIE